jgi:hypothetical protein
VAVFNRLKVQLHVVSVLLLVGLLHVTVGACAQQAASQEKGFVLSESARAAAERFRDVKKGRKLEDLELVLSEFYEWDQMARVYKRVIERTMTKQRLLELLGQPDYENEKGEAWYRHSYGSTTLFFEEGYFKDRATLIEWVAYPEQSLPKRVWHKAVRWTKKVGKLLKG